MEKKFQFFRKLLLLTLLMLGVGSAFGAGEKCAAGTQWGGFTTVVANKGSDDYYEINTPEELAWFSCEITKNGGSSQKTNAKLMQSIDLQGKLFIPISAGKGTPSYGGTFDGQGFSIKNLFIKGSEVVKSENGGKPVYAQNIGLFAVLREGTVKNLSLENVSIYAESSAGDAGTSGTSNPISVGAVVGFIESGTVDGCVVSGKIETSGSINRVGGVAGNVWAATISNSISEVDVIATGDNTHVGGIVGAIRNDKVSGTVTLSSCVYSGETLFSNNGSVGAIAGNYEKTVNITTNDLYYTAAYDAVGTGLGNKPFNSEQVENLNTEDVICELNGGTWSVDNKTCSGGASNGVWSEGQDNLSINGSDGFKVTFDPNGGSFDEGVKAYKFFAKGATITANEIENPTFAGKKFVGWSLTEGGDVQDLGTADKEKSVYAVWKTIRTITFKTAPGTFVGGSSEESKNVAEGDVVTVEGLPALPVKFCAQGSVSDCAYFYGWSTQSHDPYDDYDDIPEGTIVDLPSFTFSKDETLYAVWVKAETYTVTFNANGRGQTTVAFVKVAEGNKIEEPSAPIANNGYVFTGRWCEVIPCNDNTKFDFDNTEIGHNIILYADWSVPEYSITYMIDGEVSTTTGNVTTYDVESATITLVKPTQEGYMFDGWYDEDGNEATMILTGSTGARTFRGSLIPVTYTITYLADNTLSGTEISDVKYQGVSKELKDASYEHGGCVQDGWSKNAYGREGYQLDYLVKGSYDEDKDVILFPHWNCNTYEISYELNGGAQNSANPTEYTGPAAVALQKPTKNGYDFGGWYTESNNKVEMIQNINANTTYYAKWNLHNYKITYNLNNGTNSANNPSTYTIESEFAFADPTREGFKFIGWYGTNNFSGEKINGIKIGSTGDKRLFAKWAEYPITTTYGAITITEENENSAVAEIDGTSEETVNIPAADNVSVNQVVFNRDFSGGVRSTVMFPFTVSLDDVEGGEFWEFTAMEYDSETKKWTFRVNEPVDNELKANKPYIFIAEDKNITFNLSGAVSLSTENMNPSVHDGWVFKGSYEQITFNNTHPDWTYGYGYSDDDKKKVTKGKFVRFKTSGFDKVNLTPMRAYLVYQPSLNKSANIDNEVGELPEFVDVEIVGKKGFVIGGGIFNTKTGEFKMDRWYDLSGRRLNGKPTTQGTYYYNGKRVIIR